MCIRDSVYLAQLANSGAKIRGVCAATRGDHGQSVAFAAAHHGIPVTIVVPVGNSPDKNRAMKAIGLELIVQGTDFDEAVVFAHQHAAQNGLHLLPSFDEALVCGVGSYALGLFRAVSSIDRVYVPVGLGSGACGVIAPRNALQLLTEVIGVVSANANIYQLSMKAGKPVETNSANTIADVLAVRNANAQALEMIASNVTRIISVSDNEVRAAMAYYFSDTQNVAEGAGSAGLAAVLQEREVNKGARIATVLTGSNVASSLFTEVFAQC